MADVIATFPGKMGDLFMQWPVSRAYARKRGIKIDLGMPLSLSPTHRVMLRQEEVDHIYYMPEVFERSWKRDPPSMGISAEPWRRWDTQLEMGFRDMPDDQITHYIAKCLEVPLEDLEHPDIIIGEKNQKNYCVISGSLNDQFKKSPPFWGILREWIDFMEKEFDYIYFVGTAAEMDAIKAVELPITIFDDGGDLFRTAELMNDSRLVFGSSSMIAALGGAMGLNTIRVHEDIAPLEKKVWDFLLPNQLNYRPEDGDGVEVLQKYMERWC